MTRLGVSVVLSATATTTSRDIEAFARHAEQAGLDGIFTGDRLAAPVPRLDAAIAWDAVGIPSSERGRATDTALKVLPDLITGAPATLNSGARLQLAPGAAMPPLWIGGMSAAAQRRAARFGDAWFPSIPATQCVPMAGHCKRSRDTTRPTCSIEKIS